MSMITLKIRYSTSSENSSRILQMIKNYNSIFNLTYNYVFENREVSTKEINAYIKSKNNLFLDTGFRSSAIYDTKELISRFPERKVIFGGKKNFISRCQNKITHEEFCLNKLHPLYSVGDASHKGNRKFQLLSENKLLFKPSKNEHFILKLKSVGKNYSKKLKQLLAIQEGCLYPITYRLDREFVYISFENNLVEKIKPTKKVQNRVFAIDMNPNFIGWSVVDWTDETNYKLIDSGMFSLKNLNDYENNLHVASSDPKAKYVTNKRNTEICEIAHMLCNKANHYHCEIFSLENLKFTTEDRGRRLNKLVNKQWCRNKLVNVIHKLTDLYGVYFQEISPEFSSFIGNLVYRQEKLPDPVLASIEIGRRGFEYYNQYIAKRKKVEKNIIFPNIDKVRSHVIQSLEELNYVTPFSSLKELYYTLKKTRIPFRFSISSANSFLSKTDKRSFQTTYWFCKKA